MLLCITSCESDPPDAIIRIRIQKSGFIVFLTLIRSRSSCATFSELEGLRIELFSMKMRGSETIFERMRSIYRSRLVGLAKNRALQKGGSFMAKKKNVRSILYHIERSTDSLEELLEGSELTNIGSYRQLLIRWRAALDFCAAYLSHAKASETRQKATIDLDRDSQKVFG